jgi:hypothetical protein
LEPKAIRPVSKKEGSAWAEKPAKKEGRAFFKFGSEGKKATEEKEEDGGKNVGIEVDAEGKMIPAMEIAAEDQEKLTKKKGRGALGGVGDFLFGSGGGKAQGKQEDEVEEREEEGAEKMKVWGSRTSSGDAVVGKEEMEVERAAAAAAAEKLAAWTVEKKGKEEGMEASEDSAAAGSKWMRKGHAAIHVEEKEKRAEETVSHASIDKKLRQAKGGEEAQDQAPPSKKVFV